MRNSLKQRILALLLPLALLLSAGAQAASEGAAPAAASVGVLYAEDAPLLKRTQTYNEQLFLDVDPTSWYYGAVVAGYEYGLFNGRGDGFAPNAEITVAELLTLSARIHAAYSGGAIPPAAEGAQWFEPYILYLYENDLLDASLSEWTSPATRGELAAIFSLSLPEECYSAPNDALVTAAYATGDYIADVTGSTPYADQILWMYRQGLLSGMDDTGSYRPDTTTTRAEVAAVVTRIVDPSLRITLSWAVDTPSSSGHSAAGRTLASLIEAPAQRLDSAPRSDEEIDALIRQMLAANEDTLTFSFAGSCTQRDLDIYARYFMDQMKSYCEQMYNSLYIEADNGRGIATLTFSATACSDETLARCREQTMQKAIEIHDMLWETGALNDSMNQREIAAVYYRWLCDHCAYDDAGALDNESIAHLAYAALINENAVCDGYTGAYNLFLKLEGIDCCAQANETHIWTVATLDGVTYHIDTTWGDQVDHIDMDFFAMTPEESARVHRQYGGFRY